MNLNRKSSPPVSPALLRKLAALLLATASVSPTAGAGMDANASPGLLFYASFDGEHETSFEVIDDSHAQPGQPGLYPNADFAQGSSIPRSLLKVERIAAGRFGAAAHVPPGGWLVFDATGNVLAQRGTIAFWVQVEQSLWSVPFRQGRYSTILDVGDLQYPMMGFPLHRLAVNTVGYRLEWRYGDREPIRFGREHEYEIVDTRWGADFAQWTWSEHTHLAWAPETEWQPGEWRHIALVWDAAVGRRLYIDGASTTSWDFQEFRAPFLNSLSLGGISNPGHQRTQPLGLFFDEVYVFDYPLDGEAIKQLAETNEPPRQRLEPSAATLDDRLAWVIKKHDLQDPAIPRYTAGGLRVQQVNIDRIRNVRARRHEVMDGKLHLAWPVQYKDYSHAGLPYVLMLEFDEPRAFNLLRLRGSFKGTLLQQEAALATFESETFTQRKVFETPQEVQGILELQRESGSVNLLDFYLVEPAGPVETVPLEVYQFVGGSPHKAGAAAATIQAVYPPIDAEILTGISAVQAGNPGHIEVSAGQRIHLITTPRSSDALIGSVTFEWALTGFPADTVLLLQGHDPVIHHRELFEFDLRFDSSATDEKLLVEVHFREPIALRAGQALWFSALFDGAGRIETGPAGTRMALYAPVADPAPLRHLEHALCDHFLYVSEPQIWNTHRPAQRGNPRGQFKALAELMTRCEHLLHFEPDNWTARSLYSWVLRNRNRWDPEIAARYEDPMEAMEVPVPEDNGPEWAVWSRASLQALRRHVDWWIEERQSPNGEFGGGVNDDSTMVPDWVSFAMIHDPEGRYRDSLRRLALLAWDVNMPEGLTVSPKGHLHAFEQGKNIIPFLQLLYYGNPRYLELLMKSARWYDGHLTAMTPRGKRHFRSMWVSAEAVPTDGQDTGWAILFKPGRYLAWYNRHPEVIRVLREWMDAWLSYGRDPLHPFGEHAIDFATGEPQGAFSGSGIWHHLYWLYELTRDETYVRPVLDGLRAGGGRLVGANWAEWRRLHPDPELDALVLRRERQPAFEPGHPDRREGLIRSLQDSVLHMEKYLPIHTWVGQSTDRVPLRHVTAQSMALGGLPTRAKRIGHMYHAVSWEGADYDVARFVLEHAPDRLRVLLYSFHDEPQDVVMRVWRLDHGRYAVRGGPDLGGNEQADHYDFEREKVLFRHEPVAFRLPPRQQYVLELEQIERRDEDIRNRPDLALAPGDAVWAAGTIQVTVHNIGGGDAPPATVRLERRGVPLAEQNSPPLPVARDLYPSRTVVEFDGIEKDADLFVVIDPDQSIPEITRVNNRVAVKIEP